MALRPVLASVQAVYRKMEREAYRSLHAHSKEHKADHFFNFCVTAHAMRDFFFERKRIPKGKERTNYHENWELEPLLVAVREIANLSKHFQLRDRSTQAPLSAQTKRLVQRSGTAIDVYLRPDGDIYTVPRTVPEIVVITSKGEAYGLWEFMVDVLEVWRTFLRRNEIKVRKQPLSALQDSPLVRRAPPAPGPLPFWSHNTSGNEIP